MEGMIYEDAAEITPAQWETLSPTQRRFLLEYPEVSTVFYEGVTGKKSWLTPMKPVNTTEDKFVDLPPKGNEPYYQKEYRKGKRW